MGATLRRPKIESLVSEIDDLKNRVETMMHEQVTPIFSDAASRARHMAGSVASTTRHEVDAVVGHVRGNPLTAVLIAAGVGYLVGRFTTSR